MTKPTDPSQAQAEIDRLNARLAEAIGALEIARGYFVLLKLAVQGLKYYVPNEYASNADAVVRNAAECEVWAGQTAETLRRPLESEETVH